MSNRWKTDLVDIVWHPVRSFDATPVVTQRQMGREDFLAKEAARHERQIARPIPFAFTLLASVAMVGAVFGAYEVVAFGISKVAGKGPGQVMKRTL